MTLTQGDTALDTDLARGLRASTEPARPAFTAADGTPRVLSMWFLWSAGELVLAPFAGTAKVAALRVELDVPGVRMVRIGLRPSWVGTPDVRTRFPAGSAR